MSDIKWIKLSVNMFDDEKIKLIRTMPEGDAIVIIWVQILCLAGKINDNGMVYMGQNLAYSDEMLATILDHPVNTMRIALQTLEQFGMVEVNKDGTIDVLNWEKHQSTDKMAMIKHDNQIRQQRYYYRNKLRKLGVNTEVEGFPTDIDGLKDLAKQAEKPNVRLTLPNGQEVRSKKKEVRGKKKEVNTTTTEKKEENPKKSGSGDKLPSKNVFGAFEELWMFPNFVQKEILIELSEKYGDDLTFAAIKVAGSKDVDKSSAINFVEAVLKEWTDNNVKDIEQAREYTRNRNKQNKRNNYNKQPGKKESLPDWANEENSTHEETVDVETEKDMKERLKKIRAMRVGENS